MGESTLTQNEQKERNQKKEAYAVEKLPAAEISVFLSINPCVVVQMHRRGVCDRPGEKGAEREISTIAGQILRVLAARGFSNRSYDISADYAADWGARCI